MQLFRSHVRSLSAIACLLASVGFGADPKQFPHMAAAESVPDRHWSAQPTRKIPNEFGGVLIAQPRTAGLSAPERKLPARFPGGEEFGSLQLRSQERLVPFNAGGLGRMAIGSREAVDPRAELIRPVYGATLTTHQNFSWTAGNSADEYWLWLGSCYDCTDLFDGSLGKQRTADLIIPSDGRRIYAVLFTYAYGNWWWVDYEFVAPNDAGQPAAMISPDHGSTLSATQTFTWNSGRNVEQYWLWIGSCQDCTDILDESQGSGLSRNLRLPTDSRLIYVTLFSYVNGSWYWFDYQYRAASASSGDQTATVTLNVTNRLIYPINLSINGSIVGSVPTGETRSTTARVSSLSVSWELIRPSVSGRAIGDEMTGRFAAVNSPSGTYALTIDNRVGDQSYFVPLITNRTSANLLVEVNGGLQAQNRCNCVVNANRENVAVGYYRLFSNSNVRLFRQGSDYTGAYRFWGTSDGRVAPGPLPDYVEAQSGIVRLTATIAP